MPEVRSVQAKVPRPAAGRNWQAAALLEAPDINGHPGGWEALEAIPIAPGGVVPDTISSRHAQHEPGWYRLQWYDDGQNSKFSEPQKISSDGGSGGTPGRWN